MNRPYLYVLVGIPGSGKTTYGKTIGNAIYISSDDIRKEMFGTEEEQRYNDAVFTVMKKRTARALNNGLSVVYDATNLTAYTRKKLLRRFWKTHPIAIQMADSWDTLRCSENNKLRDRKVPDEVILRMHEEFEPVSYDEGFEDIFVITHDQDAIQVLPDDTWNIK